MSSNRSVILGIALAACGKPPAPASPAPEAEVAPVARPDAPPASPAPFSEYLTCSACRGAEGDKVNVAGTDVTLTETGLRIGEVDLAIPIECGAGEDAVPGQLGAGDLTGDGADEILVITQSAYHGGGEGDFCVLVYELQGGAAQLIFSEAAGHRSAPRYGEPWANPVILTAPGKLEQHGVPDQADPGSWTYDATAHRFVKAGG
jgi:hypothetical protein